MKKAVYFIALAVLISGFVADEAKADTYHEYKACLRNCINTTNPWTWARAKCGADCTAAWVDQKISININIGISSTGYDDSKGIPNLMVYSEPQVTVDFDILTGDALNSIDLILVDDENNPDDPAFGVVVGSDNDGGDGWSITFSPASFTSSSFSGVLVAQADFVGHDPEIDGDQAVIMIGTMPLSPTIPTLSEWGAIVMILLLLGAGTMVFGRMRRTRIA